jgi:hypothetical protein
MAVSESEKRSKEDSSKSRWFLRPEREPKPELAEQQAEKGKKNRMSRNIIAVVKSGRKDMNIALLSGCILETSTWFDQRPMEGKIPKP